MSEFLRFRVEAYIDGGWRALSLRHDPNEPRESKEDFQKFLARKLQEQIQVKALVIYQDSRYDIHHKDENGNPF